jgi:large subunit ribosomal protein L28
MSRRDDITGRKSLNGYRSSHANNKTKHKFKLNLQRKKFFLEEEGRWITLKVSAATMRTINKNGLAAVLREAKQRGTLNQEVAFNG